MFYKHLRFFVLAAPLWLVGLNQAPTAHASEVKNLLEAAKKNGETKLNLSWGQVSLGGPKGAKMFEALFNQMYGTDIKLVFTPGPSMPRMAGKIIQEVTAGRKPSTDVLIGMVDHYAGLVDRNVLESYPYTKLSSRITEDLMAPKNIGVEVYTSIPGILYNTNLVSPAEVPRKSLTGVLKPKWKGRIASTPYAAYFDRVAMRPEWSIERMKAFGVELSKYVGGLLRVGEDQRIGSGEFALFVMAPFQGALKHQSRGAPLGFVIPEDSATVNFAHLGVPRNAVAPNLAKLFINMVVSKQGQKIIYKTYYTDHHKLAGSQSAEALKKVKSARASIMEINAQFVYDHPEMKKLQRAFSKILRKKN